MTIVAVHQPNFLPWLGYFAKMAKCDIFILLDDASPPLGGATWLNRTKLCVASEPRWITAPVLRASRRGSVSEMRFANNDWRVSLVKTITMNYGRARNYYEVLPFIESHLDFDSQNVANFNCNWIESCAQVILPRVPHIVRSSSLGVQSTGIQRVLDLVGAVDGSCYLSGDGAGGYQQDIDFHRVGIDLLFNRFVPRPYPQNEGDFIPGLSVVDALFNLGFNDLALHMGEYVKEWCRSGTTTSGPST